MSTFYILDTEDGYIMIMDEPFDYDYPFVHLAIRVKDNKQIDGLWDDDLQMFYI